MILRSPNGVLPRLGSFSASKVPIEGNGRQLSLGQLRTDGRRLTVPFSIGAITGISELSSTLRLLHGVVIKS
jgi:hypothetical protein